MAGKGDKVMRYFGSIIAESLTDTKPIKKLKIVHEKEEVQDGELWHLNLVEVDLGSMESLIEELKPLIKDGWFLHFYNDKELIVVFPNKAFYMKPDDKNSWKESIEYGKSIGVEDEYLEYYPISQSQHKEWLDYKGGELPESIFHGLVVEESLRSPNILKNNKVIKREKEGGWVLTTLEIKEQELNELIKLLQENMLEGKWYAHFYTEKGEKLVVVFKEAVFETDSNPENWSKIIEYGSSIGIPSEQLDFKPCKFKDEE